MNKHYEKQHDNMICRKHENSMKQIEFTKI